MDKSELKYKNRAFFQKIKFQCDFCPKPGINKIVYTRDKEDISSPNNRRKQISAASGEETA